jgi:hypothetical protein
MIKTAIICRDPEPDSAYQAHIYAWARAIGNSTVQAVPATHGKVWHWAGAAHEHSAPLKSPNADTASSYGYNIANNASPQRRTFLSPTSEGDKKHLYGQGKPMAKDASGDGADFSTGEVSDADDGGGGTVQAESRLFFDGTVAPTDMSRATDAREKGRIGILGSGLSYVGLAGRVTSETIGRDLNPLGRGDGNAYTGGQLNLGKIAPRLPLNVARTGTGNSVNNAGQLGLGGGGGGGNGEEPLCSCNKCCALVWGMRAGMYACERLDVDECAAECDLCNRPGYTDCMDASCRCAQCKVRQLQRCPDVGIPNLDEQLCQCGCPGHCATGGGGGGTTGGGGCPGCGGTHGEGGIEPTQGQSSWIGIGEIQPGACISIAILLLNAQYSATVGLKPGHIACYTACYLHYGFNIALLEWCINGCDRMFLPKPPPPSGPFMHVWNAGNEEDICTYVVNNIVPLVCLSGERGAMECYCDCTRLMQNSYYHSRPKDLIIDTITACCPSATLPDIRDAIPWL